MRASATPSRRNDVEARTKVAKRTLYSRWTERDDLILAGLNTLALDLVAPRTGSLVGDPEALYDEIADALDSPRWLIAARCSFELPDHPDLYARFQRDCIDKPLAVVEDVLRDAQLRGELRAGIDRSVATETFTGSIAGFSSHIARLRGVSAYGARAQFLDVFLHGLRADDARE
ncbi:TetR-like C-terminal domain-containing protein [Streptomyces sp. NPDC047461]|uniref:TetR-like C-terminal domain-containing protein n=1 Tax=Streptomyces sp. NPDC047461 TaxID=3155619 RepID=UPI0033D765E7